MWSPLDLLPKPRLSVDEEIMLKPVAFGSVVAPTVTTAKPRLLSTAELLKHYGKPGDPDNSVTITVPEPFFIIAWDGTKTNRVSCHKKIADRFLKVLNDLLSVYGEKKIIELGINLFGGLYNFRPQRGLEKKYEAAIKAKNFSLAYTYLSRHSWRVAVDLDPARNQLKQTSKTAQFAKPEYKPMNDIFYQNGFIGYGRERNNDWMHFEIGIII